MFLLVGRGCRMCVYCLMISDGRIWMCFVCIHVQVFGRHINSIWDWFPGREVFLRWLISYFRYIADSQRDCSQNWTRLGFVEWFGNGLVLWLLWSLQWDCNACVMMRMEERETNVDWCRFVNYAEWSGRERWVSDLLLWLVDRDFLCVWVLKKRTVRSNGHIGFK